MASHGIELGLLEVPKFISPKLKVVLVQVKLGFAPAVTTTKHSLKAIGKFLLPLPAFPL